MQMTVGDDVLNFYYDSGAPVLLTYNGTAYYYVTLEVCNVVVDRAVVQSLAGDHPPQRIVAIEVGGTTGSHDPVVLNNY